MKALVYHGPDKRSWDDVPRPALQNASDSIVRVDAVTICGTDPHILKGDVPTVDPGRILGHEAVGTVEEVRHAPVRPRRDGGGLRRVLPTPGDRRAQGRPVARLIRRRNPGGTRGHDSPQ